MGPFESAVENALIDDTVVVTEAAGDLWEAPKVDYWRTTDGGHRVGFKGSPGKGTPVAGNPHVVGGGKAAPKGKSKGGSTLPKRAGGKKADAARKARAAKDKRDKKKYGGANRRMPGARLVK